MVPEKLKEDKNFPESFPYWSFGHFFIDFLTTYWSKRSRIHDLNGDKSSTLVKPRLHSRRREQNANAEISETLEPPRFNSSRSTPEKNVIQASNNIYWVRKISWRIDIKAAQLLINRYMTSRERYRPRRWIVGWVCVKGRMIRAGCPSHLRVRVLGKCKLTNTWNRSYSCRGSGPESPMTDMTSTAGDLTWSHRVESRMPTTYLSNAASEATKKIDSFRCGNMNI